MIPSPHRPPAALDAERLESGLAGPDGAWARVSVVARTGSTNADAVAAALADPAGWPDLSVLATDHQDAGRGRLDRQWIIEPGAGVAVSAVLRPTGPDGRPLPVSAASWLTLIAALALTESLGGPDGVAATIKWPNDVLVGGRKIAGILAQLATAPARASDDGAPAAVVLGVGINVAQDAEQLPVPTAVSLAVAGSRRLDATEVTAGFLTAFASHYRAFCARGGDATMAGSDGLSLIRAVSLRMDTLGRRVRVHLPDGAELTGEAMGLAPDGALELIADDLTQHTVHAADVVHLRREEDDA